MLANTHFISSRVTFSDPLAMCGTRPNCQKKVSLDLILLDLIRNTNASYTYVNKFRVIQKCDLSTFLTGIPLFLTPNPEMVQGSSRHRVFEKYLKAVVSNPVHERILMEPIRVGMGRRSIYPQKSKHDFTVTVSQVVVKVRHHPYNTISTITVSGSIQQTEMQHFSAYNTEMNGVPAFDYNDLVKRYPTNRGICIIGRADNRIMIHDILRKDQFSPIPVCMQYFLDNRTELPSSWSEKTKSFNVHQRYVL